MKGRTSLTQSEKIVAFKKLLRDSDTRINKLKWQLAIEQEGLCGMCREPLDETLVLDHDHNHCEKCKQKWCGSVDAVRCVAHGECNLIEGFMRKVGPESDLIPSF